MKLIVSPIDLRKGMYVSELDRPWLETAFPFQGFRITTSDEIDQISSLCDFVFVDTEKSTVPVPEPRAARNGGAGQETEQVTARIIKLAKPYRNNFEDEYPIAKGVYQNAQNMLGELLNDARVGKSLDIKEAQRLVNQMVDSILRNPNVLVLLASLGEKNDALLAHALTVCALSLSLGRYIGLDKDTLVDLGMGALIHDIGETKLPDKLLTDSDDLSDEDRALLQSHTRIGKIIVDKLAGVSDRVTAIIRDHHERANGSGYPRKLVNSQVNICTRIVSIVDTYDSLTSGTHGREKIPVDVALKYIYSWRGNLFDALLVEKFIQCIGIYPIGSAVELGSGHIAMVISSLPKARLFPTVLLILDPEGVPLERPKMMNLALFKNEGDDDNHYEVKRLVDPQAYHIDMRGVVLRELGGA
jgi:HD-GYP domain-containing protein (c-di-GMP phosphodiesterase class II)